MTRIDGSSAALTRRSAIVLCAAAAALAMTAGSAGAAINVSDHVWSNGARQVDWGPGIWTRNGVHIGATFPLGKKHFPNGMNQHDWDMIKLPAVPNDFHFAVVLGNPTPQPNIIIDVWFFWNDFTLPNPTTTVNLFTLPQQNNMNISWMVDLSMDHAVIAADGQMIFDGSYAQVNQNGLPGSEPAGMRSFDVPSPGAGALAALAGLVAFARRRR